MPPPTPLPQQFPQLAGRQALSSAPVLQQPTRSHENDNLAVGDREVECRLAEDIEAHAGKCGLEQTMIKKWLDGDRKANEVCRSQDEIMQATKRKIKRGQPQVV
ncbi:hypothetical protein BAUCODRAFT_118927 [Baudoinia panamericana UAMH 10762]|uniref:Uncharacterized protein n=1 Tax=Baudoinia panamericana (strain UAMH 10762) TaxID=717646 RepID=M2NAG7_BAUPA|nr:uncharacterized protein BAUCODRAFT_118927 [Baudoinia panamericana UAMH 10762]EMD01219.1 hypothetical protein BAUCODRAFT_118927 [Baudoinia panamericana UAMH 10762]